MSQDNELEVITNIYEVRLSLWRFRNYLIISRRETVRSSVLPTATVLTTLGNEKYFLVSWLSVT